MSSLFVGKNRIRVSSVESTNTYAIELLRQSKLTEGTIVITENQTDGRGQRGNTWKSEGGKNLTFSLVLLPKFLNVSEQFYLSKITALAIADCLSHFLKDSHFDSWRLTIKWPNDILINEKKISGTLIENQFNQSFISSSVVGIGININQLEFGSDLVNVTSLQLLTKHAYDLNEVLDVFSDSFELWYLKLRALKLQEITDAYIKRLFGLGRQIKFQVANHTVDGIIMGVERDGRIRIEIEKESRLFELKEIKFIY